MRDARRRRARAFALPDARAGRVSGAGQVRCASPTAATGLTPI